MKYFVTARLSENISKTPEGYLVCIGVPICRTGVQIYDRTETPLEPGPNGKVEITRPEEEVFRPETLASFEGKSVTVTHPTEFVNPKNWKNLTVGTMQNVRRGDKDFSDSCLADLMITDEMGIALVEGGLREVSCGYDADYEQEEPGKGVQRNIVGNHLALVESGRAGSNYAINDHKGKAANKMSLKDQLKALRAKFTAVGQQVTDAQKEMDAAMEAADAEPGEQSKQDPASGKPAMAKDAEKMYDDIKKMCDALSSKIDAMGSKKADDADGEDDPPPAKKKKDDVDVDDADEGSDLEARISKMEACIKQLMSKAGDDDEDVEDADGDDEESEDDDFDESAMVGDAAMKTDIKSRAEILAPGIKFSKDVKVAALKTAFATKDGAQIIKALNGGKEPAWDKAEKVEALFIAASEVMKAKRVRDNAKTKQVRDSDGGSGDPHAGKAPTVEEINATNAKHFGLSH